MSTHLQQTIRALEQDLEVKQGECSDIELALIPLRRMAGLSENGDSPAPRRKYTRRQIKAAKKNDRQTDRQTDRAKRGPTVSRRAPRSLPDDAKLQAIVVILNKHGGSMTPSALADALGIERPALTYRIKPFVASGALTVSGATLSRLVHVGKVKSQPAAGPKPNGSMKTAAPSTSTSAIDVILDRDRSVLGKIREAGPKGLSLRELGILLSGEGEASLSSALTRLRVKKQIHADDNGKWVSA